MESVKPGTGGQWVSALLSNPSFSFAKIGGVIGAVLLFAMTACAPVYSQADWSAYVSKQDIMRFVAPAICGLPDVFNPVAGNASFFEILTLQNVAGERGRYDVTYATANGVRTDRLDIKQWWVPSGRTAGPESQHCAVIAEVPRSKDGRRPYYSEPAAAKEAEYRTLSNFAAEIFISVLLLFVLALLPSIWGCSSWEEWGASASFAGATLLISLVAMYLFLERPWGAYQSVLQYYKFFDGLPRQDGRLLPVSPAALYFLIKGPPHPSEAQFFLDGFVVVTVLFSAIWLIATTPRIVAGVYWLMNPLPLQRLHNQALREGRRPTADEITAAIIKANVGKRPWQLRIMRRKAEKFAHKLNDIARHL